MEKFTLSVLHRAITGLNRFSPGQRNLRTHLTEIGLMNLLWGKKSWHHFNLMGTQALNRMNSGDLLEVEWHQVTKKFFISTLLIPFSFFNSSSSSSFVRSIGRNELKGMSYLQSSFSNSSASTLAGDFNLVKH